MLIKQNARLGQIDYIKNSCVARFFLLCIGFICPLIPLSLYGDESTDIARKTAFKVKTLDASRGKELGAEQYNNQTLIYYLYIEDFLLSFIEIPTSNVSVDGSTISSKYLAGRAAIYNTSDEKFGVCSASFLCMQTEDGVYTDISNFLSADNGLIVSWFTPTTLVNLELDTIINSMVTDCTVVATTKVGFNPFFGQTFNLIVSSDNEKIYFEFSRIGTIF